MVVMIVAQAEMMLTCEWLPLYIRPFVSGKYPCLFRSVLSSAFLNIFQFKCNIWSLNSRFYFSSLIRTAKLRLLLFSRRQIGGRNEHNIKSKSIISGNKIASLSINPKRKLPTVQNPKIIPRIPLPCVQSMHIKIHPPFPSLWRLHRFLQLNPRLALLHKSHHHPNLNPSYVFPQHIIWNHN